MGFPRPDGAPDPHLEAAMFPITLLLIPALVAQAPVPPGPEMVEATRGVFILKGAPTAATFADLKPRHITQVIDVRREGDSLPDQEVENRTLTELGVAYTRYAITRTPPAGDLDFLREILRGIPKGERILIHCTDGNRAGAALCPWLVLDRGMKTDEALRTCRQGGMVFPETEAAVRKYLAAHGKS